jgi:FtsH-binding integral membrane protein
MPWMHFILQVLPVTLLALAGTGLGLVVLPSDLALSLEIPLLLSGLLLFVAMITFKGTSGWNVFFLLGFSLVVGVLLRGFVQEEHGRSWSSSFGVAIGILVLSAGVGRSLRGRLFWLGKGFWILSWIYLAGWGLIVVLHPGALFQILWAGAGLVIFSGLAAAWFAGLGEHQEGASGVPLAVDLYILAFNLAVATQIVCSGIASGAFLA